MSLIIEHLVTADMNDGQPLPPFYERDAIWCVVRRLPDQMTLWRSLFLSPLRAPISPPTARVPHDGIANGNKQ
jgi:hypothetical protein